MKPRINEPELKLQGDNSNDIDPALCQSGRNYCKIMFLLFMDEVSIREFVHFRRIYEAPFLPALPNLTDANSLKHL